MATGKLLGTDVAGTGQSIPGYVQGSQYTSDFTGLVSVIKVRCIANGYARVAIYSDSGSDTVGDLLAESNSTYVIKDNGASWEPVPLQSSVYVISGTKYWLMVQVQAQGPSAHRSYTRWRGYKAQDYGAFPSDGTGFTHDQNWEYSLQGFGVLVVTPSSTVQPISYGTSTVEVGAGLTIIPTSTVQAIAYGTPVLIYPQTIAPSSIVQAIVIGTPTIIGGETGPQTIVPTSIVQQISIGSPTILKYVWHVILDGRYNIGSPEVNRAYVIGRDQYGNPVYGTAVDSAELGLVGERLDFQQELAIPTSSQAESMAGAILSKMRLTGKKGVIFIPPNCGQELFDVVEVTDTKGNQQEVKFCVVGIRFEYNPRQARYQQKLILGAP